jgi:hypothetical protein
MMLRKFLLLLVAAFAPVAFSQEIKQPNVHLIYMGGNDCPFCVAWVANELPILEKSDEFTKIQFSKVVTAIKSPVPPRFFLPSEVKPFKEKLDYASSGRSGSPQFSLMVDGEVYDYFHGTRTAKQIEDMLVSVRNGTTYPFKRCIKASDAWKKCEIAG